MVEPHTKSERAKGHRQRLKDRFVAGDQEGRHEEALLELLLTYAIPQQDVQPLATTLLATLGSLEAVLAADMADLCAIDGLKAHSAILLKLTHWIGTHALTNAPTSVDTIDAAPIGNQPTLPDLIPPQVTRPDDPAAPVVQSREVDASTPQSAKESATRRQTALFANALLRDTIAVLPRLPETASLDEVRVCIRSLLHYNGEQTRHRYASYITRRLFPDGRVDRALPAFARAYAGRQELRDVCFYRFCRAEPLMYDLIADLVLPSIGSGHLERYYLRGYLGQRFPDAAAQTVDNCGKAAVQALETTGLASSDRQTLTYAYRDIRIPAFAFIVLSEFPVPGMYDIAKLEQNRAIRSMLWNPDRLLPALYELRNRGLISKVSEIDSVRQFTTRATRDEVVEALCAGEAS